MAQKPNQAAVTQFEVVFKEVDALYDLPMRRLVGTPNKPKVAINNTFRDPLLMSRYSMPEFVDEVGEKIDDVTSDVPGMYGGVRVSGYAPFWQSFSRKRAGAIDKKYVYVFSADSPEGGSVVLEHELYFDKGDFSFIDLEPNASKDVRPAGSKKQKSLWLDLVRTRGGKASTPAYFALLAPFQIPWARLTALLTDPSLPARAQRLGDALWTDGFPDGDPSKAKTVHELFKGNKPDTIGYLLYVVDPLKEALLRVEPYQKYLDKWLDKQVSMANDDEYVLGKRVDVLARGYKLHELVNQKLPAFLRDKEQDLFKLRLASDSYCENLMRWVAYDRQHDRVGQSDVCYRDGSGKEYQPQKSQPYSQAWCSPFSEVVRDYLAANDDTYALVLNIVLAVQARLAESEAGLTWMEKTFDDLVAKKFPVSTAGSEMGFEAARKGTGAPAEGWAHLFKHWAPIWTKKYRSEATKNIQNWLKETHGVTVAELSPAQFRREWRAMKKGRKNPDALWIDSSKTKAGKLGKTGLDHLMLGIETYNLSMSVMKLVEEPNGWNAMGLVGSIADFYSAAAKVSSRLEEAEVTFKYAGATKVLKIAPFISVVSSLIDFVMAGKDMLEAKTAGEKVGHGLRGVGAALTVVSSGAGVLEATGAVTSEVGWGVPVLVVGLLLESGGSFVASNMTPASVFLRHCKWGTGGGFVQRNLDRFDDGNFLGYKGKLADLGGDIQAQHKVLNELIYDYEPKLQLEDDKSVIVAKSLMLKTGTPEKNNPLNPKSAWTIELAIDHGDGKPPDKWTFKPDELQTDEDASMNEPIVVKAYTKMKDADAHQQAHGSIKVVGTAKLDPFGNGKYVIEREIKDSFTLSWF